MTLPKKIFKRISEVAKKEDLRRSEVVRRAVALYHHLMYNKDGRAKEIMVLRSNKNISHITMMRDEDYESQFDLYVHLAQNYKQREIKKITIEKENGELEEILVKDILPK